MNTPRISQALYYIDEELISEAAHSRKTKTKFHMRKIATMAACLVLVAVVGVGLFQSGVLGGRTEVATLSDGSKITFAESSLIATSSLDLDAPTKPLTEAEAAALFGDLPVTGVAAFENNNTLLGFTGKIDSVDFIITTSEVTLRDTVIEGTEETCQIDGTAIAAGYFITDPNSRGEQNAIYYASFEIGECDIYLEIGDARENSESTKNKLAETIQALLKNGSPNIDSYLGG